MKDALLKIAQDAGGPILGLDTSTPVASLGLVHPGHGRVLEIELPATAKPSDSVVAGIEALLAEGQCSVTDLAAMVVGLGPGSFTGLRVGLATAKGLALGADVPLYGVSSLELLAYEAGPGLVVVAGDARRGDFYTALYERRGAHECRPILAEQVMSLPALTRAVSHAIGEDEPTGLSTVTVVGDACNHVAQAWGARAQDVPVRILYGLLAASTTIRARQPVSLDAVLPNYLRTSAVGR